MSLHLDARQRAMLQEMGIAIWAPPPAAPMPPAAAPAPPMRAAPPPAERPATPTSAPPPMAPPAAMAAPAFWMHAPQPLYSQADPAATPVELGAGWLVVLESATPAQPLAGDAGRLLDNMLRAMRLHRHPRTFVATLERPAPGQTAPADARQPPESALPQALAALRPAMVLLLGLGAARAVLDSREPLGRLRTGVHRLAGPEGAHVPAVVSYDPAYLLRAPDAKSAAWADLCRALAIVRAGTDAMP